MAARRGAWGLISSPHPFPCRQCGTTVREVVTTTGNVLIINEEPHPHGNIIPWPAPNATGMAQARIITVPVTDQQAWVRHDCPANMDT